MIEDRLNDSLITIGYQRLESNAPGIYLYHLARETQLNIVSIIHAINGDELTALQYEHLLEQMKGNFQGSFPQGIRLLSLVFTQTPDKAKHFCSASAQDSHWIVDLNTNRLMIYETQSNEFDGLKETIERLLVEELQPARKASVKIPFTLVVMIIIVSNVIAFLITNYTAVFGGVDLAFYRGALSWYYVFEEKQYYRLITSMFMHANFSHIFNNMLVLFFIGTHLERAVGKLKFLFIYFGAGILAGVTSISYNMWKENNLFVSGESVMAIGASGAIFGVVGALLYIVIVNKGKVEQISMRQMIIFVILSLYSGIINAQVDQADHIGGFLSGILLAMLVYRRVKRKTAGGEVVE